MSVKVSVIIPVYDVEKHLSKCLDSVVNQTLQDIEIICVNDCSTDRSLSILNQYAEKDSRIKVINFEENKGVSIARNAALDIAKGQYVGFVDADDYIDLDYYEKLYTKAIENNSDIAKADIKDILLDGTVRYYQDLNKKILSKGKLCFINFFTLGIYSLKIIKENNIKFAENKPFGEDILFLNDCVICSNGVSIVDDTYYYYIRRENSANSHFLDSNKVDSGLFVYTKIKENINSISTFGDDYIDVYIHLVKSTFGMLLRSKDFDSKVKCIEFIFKIIHDVKIDIDMDCFAIKESPYFIDFVKNNDSKGLCEFFMKNDTAQKLQLAVLRYNLKNR